MRAALFVPSLLYGRTAGQRMALPGRQAALPVVCIGNYVAGGAGKTPTALAIYDLLASLGQKPAFISRGYRGTQEKGGGFLVNADTHTASDVGDEPLMLATRGPTFVGSDRLTSVTKAAEQGRTCVLFDDGFQNPTVTKNLSILVVDAAVGVGNGLCHPAGPLRAPLSAQMAHTDMVILIGEGAGATPVVREAAKRGVPVLMASLKLQIPDHLRQKDLVAFCGIGRPGKFFDSLKSEGLNVLQTVPFPDHHSFKPHEADTLIKQAQANGALLVTTQKDAARLAGSTGSLQDLANVANAVRVELVFEDEAYIKTLLKKSLATWRTAVGDAA